MLFNPGIFIPSLLIVMINKMNCNVRIENVQNRKQ
jgi:hypothetical protein